MFGRRCGALSIPSPTARSPGWPSTRDATSNPGGQKVIAGWGSTRFSSPRVVVASGRLRRTPLIYGEHGDDYIVVGSNGGQSNHPNWYLNLLHGPKVQIQVRTEHLDARARVASGDERAELWSLMAGIWPDYERYAKRTEREIAVVVIQPV